jgi:hypothetical protein
MLIFTSDRSRQEQQIVMYNFFPPTNSRAVYFLVIWPNDSDREIIVFVKSEQNIVFLE